MFLVYVPIVAATSYLFLRKCLPQSARRLPQQVSHEVAFALAFATAKVVRHLAALRSSYIWEKRQQLGGPFVTLFDTLLRVDTARAVLDTSASGHDSISIISAISTIADQDCDITKLLDNLWASGNGIRVVIPMHEVSLSDDLTLTIKYRGHSNISKRYSFQIFSVRYAGQSCQSFRFPPYASSESIKRGFGVPRILRANVERSGQLLCGPEVYESSGLRRTFYADVDDDPCLQKNVITFSHASPRSGEVNEDLPVVVTTSKSKITCNNNQSSQPSSPSM